MDGPSGLPYSFWVSGLQRVNLPARIYSAMAGIIARVAKQKRGSLLWFVVVVTLVSLSLSLLFVSLLASSDRELSRTPSHHREKVRGDGSYRNILDVHYPNLEHPNMEQEAKGDKTRRFIINDAHPQPYPRSVAVPSGRIAVHIL